MSDLSGVGYLQIRRDPRYRAEVRVVKATQKPPEQLEPGCVLVKVRLSVPAEVFSPYETEIAVPARRVVVAGEPEETDEAYILAQTAEEEG